MVSTDCVKQVNLVSMPRFQHSKKFKGFAFIEFATPQAAQTALAAATDADPALSGIRAMSKRRWEELKAQLKNQLETGERASSAEISATPPIADAEYAKKLVETVDCAVPTERITVDSESTQRIDKPRRKRKTHTRAHLHFDDEDGESAEDSNKKQKTEP